MQSVLWIGFGVQETRTQKWKKGLFTPRGYGATKKNKTFLAFLHKFVQIIAKCVQISAKCVQISAKCVQISAKCVQICAKCVQICVKWMQKKYANPSKNSSQSCSRAGGDWRRVTDMHNTPVKGLSGCVIWLQGSRAVVGAGSR